MHSEFQLVQINYSPGRLGEIPYLGWATALDSPVCFIKHARAAHETCFNSGTAPSSLWVFQSAGHIIINNG
jgi:hypothetical protein